MLWEIIQKIGRIIMDIIEVIVISMSIFIVVYLFLMQPHQVKGSSMYPTFHDGEFLMTDKVSYKMGPPHRGDVVVFKAPIAQDFDFIKRVIAVPGDRIMVKQNKIWLNGEPLEEPYLPKDYITQPGNYLKEGIEAVVPPNSYMTIGDNRGHSSDSREWGPVPIENFIGKGLFRYYPFNKLWIIQHYPFGGDGQ